MRKARFAAVTAAVLATLGSAVMHVHAGFVVEIDIDGADDGVITYNPRFSFGGDTTAASQSVTSTAVGLTGGDSIFGGNGTSVDTYLYTYTPGADADNFGVPAGTALNDNGDTSTGDIGGVSGDYDVFAVWPATTSVSGGATTFTLSDGSTDLFSVAIDQNTTGGDEWVYLGTASLTTGTAYTLTQESGAATFVSMRAAGALFQPIPEPASLGLFGLGGLALLRRRAK